MPLACKTLATLTLSGFSCRLQTQHTRIPRVTPCLCSHVYVTGSRYKMYDIYFTFLILKTASESKAHDIKTSREKPKKKKKKMHSTVFEQKVFLMYHSSPESNRRSYSRHTNI